MEPFGFDPHLALGVQRILREEAHLDAVADPAGGSYFVEALTDSLAEQGWKLFQQVEAEGGYRHAVESGSLAAALAVTRAARQKAVSSRRRTLVGVNNYPDLLEKVPDAARPCLPSKAGTPCPHGTPGRTVRTNPRALGTPRAAHRPLSAGAASETRRSSR